MIISDLYTGITAHLQGRPTSGLNNTAAEYIRKVVLELTDDYKFAELEVTALQVYASKQHSDF